MKKYLLKTFSVLLAVWMIIITGGLYSSTHECSCCDTQEIAIVDIDTCCSDEEYENVCHEPEETATLSCCEQLPFTELVAGNSCSDDDCCTISHHYLVLEESFTVSLNAPVKFYPVLSEIIHAPIINDIVEDDEPLLAVSVNNSSPPGYTGKAFLIYTHTLKIPLS